MDSVNNYLVKPKRRIRYKGTHPCHFEEKYKELNFEKYTFLPESSRVCRYFDFSFWRG